MASKKTISEALVNWGLQRETVTDIVFPQTREISDNMGRISIVTS